METEDQELLKLQKKLSKSFISLSNMCQTLQKKSNKYLSELKNDIKPDVNIMQEAGIGLIHMMKMMKENMSFHLNSLEKDVKELDHKYNPMVKDILDELLYFKTSVVTLENDSGYIFSRACEKKTVTEESVGMLDSLLSFSTSDIDQTQPLNNSLLTDANHSGKALSSQSCASKKSDAILICSEVDTEIGCCAKDCNSIISGNTSNRSVELGSDSNKQGVISASGSLYSNAGCSSKGNSSTNSAKKFNLSLIPIEGSDGQDTDDSWRDTLKYSPTAVKTKSSPKQESTESEEDTYDVETVDWNYETENTPDDIFEDGHCTPKKGNIKEEPESKEESTENDKLSSDDTPPKATNPGTFENLVNGIISSESMTNLENENHILVENDEDGTNVSKTNFDKKPLTQPVSAGSKNILNISNDTGQQPAESLIHNGSPCMSSDGDSECSFETVKLSNNDSQSPCKTSEKGSRILKIPVDIDESTNDSDKYSSGSSYTIDSFMQITKKNKSSKNISSSQDLDSSFNSQEHVEKHSIESDSGNITNSQSSTSADSTDISNSSSSESTLANSSVEEVTTECITDSTLVDKLDETTVTSIFDNKSGLPDTLIKRTDNQCSQTKDPFIEIITSPVSTSCDSGNPQSDILENFSAYQYGSRTEEKKQKESDSKKLPSEPNSEGYIESATANIPHYSENTNMEHQENKNDRDGELSAIDNEINSYEQTENLNSHNGKNEHAKETAMKNSDEHTKMTSSEKKCPDRSDVSKEGKDSSIDTLNYPDDQSERLTSRKKVEYLGCGNEDTNSTYDKSNYLNKKISENENSDSTDNIEDGIVDDIFFKTPDESLQNDDNKKSCEDSESSDNEIYFQPTQKISETSYIHLGFDEDEATQVITTIEQTEAGSIDKQNSQRVSAGENKDVANDTSNVYYLATQKLSDTDTSNVENEGNRDHSKSGQDSIEPDVNEREDDISNPFSVETVKWDSDEDTNISDSQSFTVSDLLNEHNYSCASISDIDDPAKNEKIVQNPEIEDSDSRETDNKVSDKVNSELEIEDSDSDTINRNCKNETDENNIVSPSFSSQENGSDEEDCQKSLSDSLDIIDTSYIHSEHNYSSGGSPGVTEDEDIVNRFAGGYNQAKGNDNDSDETDIDREMNFNKDFVSVCEDKNSVEKKDLANLEEIPDSQEEFSLSQQSTKSYEFDISENVNNLGSSSDEEIDNTDKETTDMIHKNEKGAGIIAKELEALLSEDVSSPSKSEGHNQQQNTEVVVESLENNKEKAQAVLIDNNVQSSESLLEITMEEILSDVEKDKEKVDSQATIILDDDDIKPKLEIVIEENMLEDSKHLVQNQNDIGDEILELLKEVAIPTLENANLSQIDTTNNIPGELKEAEDILKMMVQGSSIELSESDETDDDLLLLSDISLEEADNEEKTTSFQKNKMLQVLAEHNMIDCYVDIEKLQLPKEDLVEYTKKLEDNIDWLCDLNTLNKRKNDGKLPYGKMKGVKKIRRDSSSISSSSDTDSDLEIFGPRPGTPVLPKKVEQKLDTFLANAICRDLKGSSDLSSYENEVETDDSTKKKQKNKKDTNKKGDNESDNNNESNADAVDEREKLSKEDLEKKSWKNDPLLRGKLSSGSDTGCNSKKSLKMKRKSRRLERDNEVSVASDNLDSDSDLEGVCEQNKSKLEETLISPIKRNIPSSDSSSSDSDSDIEFVSQKVQTPLKDGETAGPSPSQKGRRNIRALMSQESLAEATQKATLEEMERIERLKDRHKIIESFSQSLSNSVSHDEETVPFTLDVDEKTGEPLIEVNSKLADKLKPHQRMGIQFMWDSCYESLERMKKHDGSGCVLAHCMGLGKTLQVITLINTLFNYETTNTKHVLVVCPLSTVNNWDNEVKFAFKGIEEEQNFKVFPVSNNSDKYNLVKKWWLRKKALLIVGYECFQRLTNESELNKVDEPTKDLMLSALNDPGPDLVICDEGHLLKNKNALKSLALNKIRSKRRIVLTGTPLQNNLLEYHHMVQFVKPNLLGNNKEFKTNFVNPITNGQYEDSTEDDIKLMMKRTHVLHKLLVKTVQRIEDTELQIYLPKMQDHALFIQLNQVQVDLYNQYSEIIKLNIGKKQHKGFFSDFSVFQLICTHPHLLSIMEKMRTKRITETDVITNEDDQPICNLSGWWKDKMPKDAKKNIDYGSKLVVLKAIIEECETIGDKVLVFSQSLGELNLIEHFLNTYGTEKCLSWKKAEDYYRMDGTVNTGDRTKICDKFNDTTNKKIRLLLMSTKVGGLGLNLTGANRVIIMTVSWNPSYDTQSVFRAYRFGQEKEVYVYRLISLDTMEEKVYHRSVTKLAISHRVIDKHQITRHYQRMHLQELYSCKPSADEERPTPNVPEDQMLAKLILQLPCIFKYHEHKALLANRPEDSLSEQELTAAWEAWKNNENSANTPAKPHAVLPQRTQAVPPQKTQGVPPQKAQGVPPQKAQGVPPQKAPGVPPQKAQGVPLQKAQGVPTQKAQGVPTQKSQALPAQRVQAVPQQNNQAVPPQNNHAVFHPMSHVANPPLPPLIEALNYGVGRSNLNQLANTNLSRAPPINSSLDDNLRQYYIPKKNVIVSSPTVNSHIIENRTSNGVLPSQKLLSTSENTNQSESTRNISKRVTKVIPPSRFRRQDNVLPTVPVAKKINFSSKSVRKYNLIKSSTISADTWFQNSSLAPGLTSVNKNMERLQGNNKTNLMLPNMPKDINVVKSKSPKILGTERRLVPCPLPLGNHSNVKESPFNRNQTKSQVNIGNSTNEMGNVRSKQMNSASSSSGNEFNKKRHSNENSLPPQDRRNLVSKRRHLDDSSKKSKRIKGAHVPLGNKEDVSTIILDDIPKKPHQKENGTGSSNESRLVSINIDDEADVIFDTSSESGSLSNEIINNLKLSGVSVRPVNNVITLD
ncbi:uncharacterized protein isoform X3 [Leptinotarsa decemlineata]|uniref:uncharacterized protein isoform X3 n=1 Tax=Leptinotarsa decemlineata TaxID=7539 RepID=UPI003D305913